MDIDYLFQNTELTQQQIADKLGIHWKKVFNYIKNTYSSADRRARKAKCYRNSKLGAKNPSFGLRGEDSRKYVGLVSDSKGYLMLIKPNWYTGRVGSKHVFHHHIVMCEAMGITTIPAGHCVHHCDFNPHNNHIDNLVLLTLGEHTSLHAALAGATTISKESTTKWLEAHRAGIRRDIV